MKNTILALTLTLVTSNAFAEDVYKCFLDGVAYKNSPVVSVVVENKKTTLVFTKSSTSYKPLLTVAVEDNSEDVQALYENKAKGVSLSFYLDEGDAMGFAEGSVTSPVMNGDVRCVLSGNF